MHMTMQSTNHTSFVITSPNSTLHFTIPRRFPSYTHTRHTNISSNTHISRILHHTSNSLQTTCAHSSTDESITTTHNNPTPPPTTPSPTTSPPSSTLAVEESLRLLEWPALCKQVASFCTTPIAAQRAIRGQIPIGTSYQESQKLYKQTREARTSSISFTGIYDLRRALDAACNNQSLHPLVLGAVVTTLDNMEGLLRVLQEKGDAAVELLSIARVIGDALPQLREEIRRCIHISDGRIIDNATPTLLSIRTRRRQNLESLKKTADEWSRSLHERGIAERPQVVIRRDRQCIPIKAGRQSELPKGSILLATSGSGNTVYIEPLPLVELNNIESALSVEEEDEEERIVMELSKKVGKEREYVYDALMAVAEIDLACARAKHAAWISGVEPELVDLLQCNKSDNNNSDITTTTSNINTTNNTTNTRGVVWVHDAVHPLLLESSLPPLKPPPLPAVSMLTLDTTGPLAGINLVPELWDTITPQMSSSDSDNKNSSGNNTHSNTTTTNTRRRNAKQKNTSSLQSSQSQSSSTTSNATSMPTAIDLTVPPGIKIVAVTGPNTGGKTASLKLLGLLSIMAKAGLYLPIRSNHHHTTTNTTDNQQNTTTTTNDTTTTNTTNTTTTNIVQPRVAWFDKILADIGDGQSLSQNLSTFSGHIRRLQRIISETTPSSLVLIDEIGSGTDPGEGAALAAALLCRIAEKDLAALTYATTHHGEVKEVAFSHPLFVNASVEFDIATLRPTYKVLWGTAGESNALNVARGLGFDAKIVEEAQRVAAELQWTSPRKKEERAETLRQVLEEQLVDAQETVIAAEQRKKAAEKRLLDVKSTLQLQKDEIEKEKGTKEVDRIRTETQSKLTSMLQQVKAGELSIQEMDMELRRMEREARGADAVALTLAGMKMGGTVEMDDDDSSDSNAMSDVTATDNNKEWIPTAGDQVKVMKMGGALGTVVSGGGRGGGGKVTVRIGGTMTLEVRVHDIVLATGSDSSSINIDASNSSSAVRRRGVTKRTAGNINNNKQQQQQQQQLYTTTDNTSSSPSTSSSSERPLAPAIQTSRNTVDVRGMLSDEAVAEVELAIGNARRGSVLFIVHGIGTGRVRAAVVDALKRHPLVVKMEEAEKSNGGCTLAFLK